MDLQFCKNNCNRMEVVARQLETDYQNIYHQCLESVEYEKYGVGGALLHRGFFCPSLIYDIVNGNVRRGHISGRMPILNTCDYRFGFNRDGLPIMAHHAGTCETIHYGEQETLGVEYMDGYGLVGLSECKYDLEGKISTYSLYRFDAVRKKIFEVQTERYTYCDENLIVDWLRFNSYIAELSTFECVQYRFLVKDNYLVSYQVNSDDKRQPSNSIIYPVRVKRNIYDSKKFYGKT